MKRVILAAVLGLVALAARNSEAQIETTTQFGVTVSPEDIWTAADESRLFWAHIRKTVGSDEFLVGHDELRGQALAALRATDRLLVERALNDNHLPDVIEFLSTRIRRYTIYRQLRRTLNNDPVCCRMIDTWEAGRWHISSLPPEERAEASKKQLEEFRQTMLTKEVPANRQSEVMELWQRQADCQDHMLSLETCQGLIDLQSRLAAHDPALRNVLRRVSLAADWALITRPARSPCPRCEEFLNAWGFCRTHLPTDLTRSTAARRSAD